MKPSTQQQLWMYETMCLIRHYEDSLAIAYFEGKLPPKIQKGLAFDLGAGPDPRRDAPCRRAGVGRGRHLCPPRGEGFGLGHAPRASLRDRQGRATSIA